MGVNDIINPTGQISCAILCPACTGEFCPFEVEVVRISQEITPDDNLSYQPNQDQLNTQNDIEMNVEKSTTFPETTIQSTPQDEMVDQTDTQAILNFIQKFVSTSALGKQCYEETLECRRKLFAMEASLNSYLQMLDQRLLGIGPSLVLDPVEMVPPHEALMLPFQPEILVPLTDLSCINTTGSINSIGIQSLGLQNPVSPMAAYTSTYTNNFPLQSNLPITTTTIATQVNPTVYQKEPKSTHQRKPKNPDSPKEPRTYKCQHCGMAGSKGVEGGHYKGPKCPYLIRFPDKDVAKMERERREAAGNPLVIELPPQLNNDTVLNQPTGTGPVGDAHQLISGMDITPSTNELHFGFGKRW